MKRTTLLIPLFVVGALGSGCGSLSGVGGSNSYTCPAPSAGFSCKPVSEVYSLVSSEQEGQPLSGTKTENRTKAREATYREQTSAPGAMYATAVTGNAGEAVMPLRTPPRVLRVWFAPWVDDMQTLHDQSYSYVQVDDGRWQIDAKKAAIRARYVAGENPVKKAAVTPRETSTPMLPTAGVAHPVKVQARERPEDKQ